MNSNALFILTDMTVLPGWAAGRAGPPAAYERKSCYETAQPSAFTTPIGQETPVP
jgi:hypothetical protein